MDLKTLKPAPLDATREQVARVLNHQLFAQSRGPARLLMHLADQLAANGGAPATQQELAEVLGLPDDFDPTRNPLVRMHMSKLRRKLERYRNGDGRHDAVALDIPRNSYRLQGYSTSTDDGQPSLDSGLESDGAFAASERALVLISEFDCSGDEHAELTRGLAFWLVAELFDTLWIAAVGPVLRERFHSEESSVDRIAHRYRLPFVLRGEVSRSERGLQISMQLINTTTQAACWADWFDDPTDVSRDHVDHACRRLAGRVADRLEQCPIAQKSKPPTPSRESVQENGWHQDAARPNGEHLRPAAQQIGISQRFD